MIISQKSSALLSKSVGASSSISFLPSAEFTLISESISEVMWGYIILFSCSSFLGLLKTMSASPCLLSDLSSLSISVPKKSVTSRRQTESRFIMFLAISSALMTANPFSINFLQAVVFPEPVCPVSPTTITPSK